MSQSKIRGKEVRHTEVHLTLKEIRDNAVFGSEGVKRFLEFNSEASDDAIVIVNLETGALKLEGSEMPEAKSEVQPLVN